MVGSTSFRDRESEREGERERGGMADEYGGMGVGMSISGGMGLEGMNLRNRFISMPNVVVGI